MFQRISEGYPGNFGGLHRLSGEIQAGSDGISQAIQVVSGRFR